MWDIASREQRRLELQDALDSAKSQAERNKLGQFATPINLATDILRLAKSYLPRTGAVRFLDPALGTGSFYSALLRCFSEHRIKSAVGYEIDPHYGNEAMKLWRETPLEFMLGDFTEALPPVKEVDKANLIVCNPPYVRHHHLGIEVKQRLRRASADASSVCLNGLAGLYCHFVCLTHAWMARNALAIWLIPSEFMAVNYGKPLKEYLRDRVTLLRIHRFDPDNVQFDDALVSSAVVCFRNTPPVTGTCCRIHIRRFARRAGESQEPDAHCSLPGIEVDGIGVRAGQLRGRKSQAKVVGPFCNQTRDCDRRKQVLRASSNKSQEAGDSGQVPAANTPEPALLAYGRD